MDGSPQALAAHVFRRLTFGPHPGQVEQAVAAGDADALINRLLDEAQGAAPPLRVREDDLVTFGDDDEVEFDDVPFFSALTRRLAAPDAGLGEKMAWFWHSHFATHAEKVEDPRLLLRQQDLLRTQAMGNFRELARAMVTDGAMLRYLDGDGSIGSDPNENFAREFMELHTLGRGNYTEADVRAAARIFSGWHVEWAGEAEVYHVPPDGNRGTVEFMGERGSFTIDQLVDRICDQPACAVHIAGKLHEFLVGQPPDQARLERLAQRFRDHDLEVFPLVEAIVTAPDFLDARLSRPRQPVEWFAALVGAIGSWNSDDDMWALELLGQFPYQPPSPAGWLNGSWLAPSQMLLRITSAVGRSWDAPLVAESDLVDEIAARCGLYELSDSTRSVLVDAAADNDDTSDPAWRVFTLALTAPEFSLA